MKDLINRIEHEIDAMKRSSDVIKDASRCIEKLELIKQFNPSLASIIDSYISKFRDYKIAAIGKSQMLKLNKHTRKFYFAPAQLVELSRAVANPTAVEVDGHVAGYIIEVPFNLDVAIEESVELYNYTNANKSPDNRSSVFTVDSATGKTTIN